jgi:hypothetical protein
MAEHEAPAAFCCPIGLDIMMDPVFLIEVLAFPWLPPVYVLLFLTVYLPSSCRLETRLNGRTSKPICRGLQSRR